MGYWTAATNRWANTRDLPLRALAAATVTGTSAAVETADRAVARLTLGCTAVSGTTPSLTVTVQTSPDGVTWYTSGVFTAVTAISSESKLFLLDRFVRLSYAITGTTPSLTFSVLGEAC